MQNSAKQEPPLDVLSKFSLTFIRNLNGGHTDCTISLLVSEKNKHFILKWGVTKDAKKEIEANHVGYQAIQTSGASRLTPERYKFGIQEDTSYILMPYLGTSVAELVSDEKSIDWVFFWSTLTKEIIESVQDTPKLDRNGLQYYCEMIQHWSERLDQELNSNLKIAPITKKIAIELLETTSKTSLMLADFTPDNIFINPEGLTFIDPWQQKTYRGSFLVSLGQFHTLLCDVYDFSPTAEYAVGYGSAREQISKRLGLSKEQREKHLQLGVLMQYLLSAYVRIGHDDEKVDKYVASAVECAQQIRGL